MEPKQIDRYIVEKVLGQGGMGTVYRAHDPMMDRVVAIKTIRLDKLDDNERAGYKTRFFREVRIGGKLNHPNIVVHYDTGEFEGKPYLVMEYVEGQSLSEQMRSTVFIAPERVIQIIRQIADGLDTAHEIGIIHRDVKPQNIMLSKDDRVKILDFGIARLVESEMTQTGEFLGTPRYCSPEQIVGENVDYRADNFALAVIAHELITGQTPFPGKSFNSILYKIVHEEPQICSYAHAGQVTNQVLGTLFRKALEKKAEHRYTTAREFANELENALKMEEQTMAPGMDSPTMALPLAGESHSASQVIQDLEIRLDQELREAREQERRIRDLRDQFMDALEVRNLDLCRELFQALEAENTDTTFERKALDTLESRLAVEEHGRKARLLSEIEEKRKAYRQSIEQEDLEGAESHLSALKNLDATIDEELDLLQSMLAQREQKRRQAQIQSVKAQYQTAMGKRQVEEAKACLLKLVHLGAAEDEMRRAVVDLEREILEEEADRKRQVADLRDRFAAALRTRNVTGAGQCIQQLSALDQPVQKERLALTSLQEELDAEQRDRDAQVESLKRQLNQAIQDKEPTLARSLLPTLAELVADISKESSAVTQLEKTVRAERLTEWQNYFKQSLANGSRAEAVKALTTLEEMGEDVRALQRELSRWEAKQKKQQAQLAERIEEARASFEKAAKGRDLATCRKAIDSLSGMGAKHEKETRLLRALERDLEQEKVEREAAVAKHQEALKQALKQERPDQARQLIQTLASMQVSVTQEQRALENLEKKLRRKEEQKEAKEVKRLQGEFTKALKQEDLSQGEALIEQLAARGVQVSSMRAALGQAVQAQKKAAEQDAQARKHAAVAEARVERPQRQKEKGVPAWIWPVAAAVLLAVVIGVIMRDRFTGPDDTVSDGNQGPGIERREDPDSSGEQAGGGTGNEDSFDGNRDDPNDSDPGTPPGQPREDLAQRPPADGGEEDRLPQADTAGLDPARDQESDASRSGQLESDPTGSDSTRSDSTRPEQPPSDGATTGNESAPTENPSSNEPERGDRDAANTDQVGTGNSTEGPGAEDETRGFVALESVEQNRPSPPEGSAQNEPTVPVSSEDDDDASGGNTIGEDPPKDPEEPEVVNPPASPPYWLSQLQHETPESYRLAGRTVDIVLSRQTLPTGNIKSVSLHWRAGSDGFAMVDMDLRKGLFEGKIPRRGLKEGNFEYFFTLNLADGSNHRLDNLGKPFASELKRAKKAIGF